ncbi:hypothetical protein LSG31_22530 [Fodinisporobacter ferrooxydans]|uniref:Uncharacterized protein n=1 Tax=Fodinisporobacter ferrooxydans TaxID=2901836 RepID=A0ABY4CJ96_9BACL|nr:hypothetical protein LSG31_22530 [Alicyclobacillaceae bacterium MYW30-H2]
MQKVLTMEPYFQYSQRLLIPLPELDQEWEMYTRSEQMTIIAEWERIRAQIPVRIREFEREFMDTFESLHHANDAQSIAELSEKMAELSSIINELNVWYRQEPHISHHES